MNPKLDEALKTLEQALREVRHAQDCGANWYTKGSDGLYQQVAMWVRRGFEAIKEARTAGEAPGAAFQFSPLFAGMDVAQGQSRSGWMCTKHGVIQGPDCEQCRVERVGVSPDV